MYRALQSRRVLRRPSAVVLALSLIAVTVVPTAAVGRADRSTSAGVVLSAASIARGPSTTTDPYILPVADDVGITSLLTVNDAGAASNGYEMVGIPDGLGVTRVDDKVVILMNHELRDEPGREQGIARRHGQIGAFVSRLVIDPKTLAIKHGSDLVDPGVRYWDYPNGGYVTASPRWADMAAQQASFGRFCSSTLSDPGVFYNERNGAGYRGQIYFGNEEDGDVGRAFGITLDGVAWALPRLGLFSWENTVPANNSTDTTLVMGQEDGPGDGSQPWVYVGKKLKSGAPVARAGLTNGLSFVLDAIDPAVTNDAGFRATYAKGTPADVTLVNVPWSLTGALQNIIAKEVGLSLNRIEDGHWDPNHRNDFYFLTTEGGEKEGTGLDSRDGGGLWRLRWKDIDRPQSGATLTLLLDGSESLGGTEPKFNKPDNMTLDRRGNILIQEDPGNVNHLARIIAYRISDGALGVVARFDETKFGVGATDDPARLTIDEESSGIIDASRFWGSGTFLFDAQIHTNKFLPAGTGKDTVQEYVENGQLLLLKINDWGDVYGDD
jgi:hypothetical protein